MKTSLFRLSSLPLLVLGFSLSFTQCTDLAGLDENPDAGEQLSAIESSGILFMREEEKLARDVYLYLYEIYPLRPFLNISNSLLNFLHLFSSQFQILFDLSLL